MSSAATKEQMSKAADLTLRPLTDGIHPLDWGALERAAEAGYRHAAAGLEEWQGAVSGPPDRA